MTARKRFRSTLCSPRCKKQRAASSRFERGVPPSPSIRIVYKQTFAMSTPNLRTDPSGGLAKSSIPLPRKEEDDLIQCAPPRKRGGDFLCAPRPRHSCYSLSTVLLERAPSTTRASSYPASQSFLSARHQPPKRR